MLLIEFILPQIYINAYSCEEMVITLTIKIKALHKKEGTSGPTRTLCFNYLVFYAIILIELNCFACKRGTGYSVPVPVRSGSGSGSGADRFCILVLI